MLRICNFGVVIESPEDNCAGSDHAKPHTTKQVLYNVVSVVDGMDAFEKKI